MGMTSIAAIAAGRINLTNRAFGCRFGSTPARAEGGTLYLHRDLIGARAWNGSEWVSAGPEWTPASEEAAAMCRARSDMRLIGMAVEYALGLRDY